jgi:hypothetical protein
MRPTEVMPMTDGYSSDDAQVDTFCRFISGKIAMKVYRALVLTVAGSAALASTGDLPWLT